MDKEIEGKALRKQHKRDRAYMEGADLLLYWEEESKMWVQRQIEF